MATFAYLNETHPAEYGVGSSNTRAFFERLVLHLAASGCINDKTNIACFRLRTAAPKQVAVFARRKTAHSPLGDRRADDGVFRRNLVITAAQPPVVLPGVVMVTVRPAVNICSAPV